MPQWRIVICRQCRYAIWPAHITGHLKGTQHRLPHAQAVAIKREVEQADVLQEQDRWQLIHHIADPIDGLKESPGYQCTVTVDCQFVALAEKSMINHCGNRHPGVRRRQSQYNQGANKLWRPVQCQRMFVQGRGSNFFRVGQTINEAIEYTNAIEAAKQRVREAQRALHERTVREIQDR